VKARAEGCLPCGRFLDVRGLGAQREGIAEGVFSPKKTGGKFLSLEDMEKLVRHQSRLGQPAVRGGLSVRGRTSAPSLRQTKRTYVLFITGLLLSYRKKKIITDMEEK